MTETGSESPGYRETSYSRSEALSEQSALEDFTEIYRPRTVKLVRVPDEDRRYRLEISVVTTRQRDELIAAFPDGFLPKITVIGETTLQTSALSAEE